MRAAVLTATCAAPESSTMHPSVSAKRFSTAKESLSASQPTRGARPTKILATVDLDAAIGCQFVKGLLGSVPNAQFGRN